MSINMTIIAERLLDPFLFLFYGIEHSVDNDMTKENYRVKRLKKVSFKELKEKMLIVDWYFDPHYPKSLFTKCGLCEFHAGIWRFDDVGYMPTLYGRMMGYRLQKKIAKTLDGWQRYKKPYIK